MKFKKNKNINNKYKKIKKKNKIKNKLFIKFIWKN